MSKIYLWTVQLSARDFAGYALAEDGTGLAAHLCSSIEWAKHDMGLTSDWKHDTYAEHYPEGFELVWLDRPDQDEGWQYAFELNKEKHHADTSAAD